MAEILKCDWCGRIDNAELGKVGRTDFVIDRGTDAAGSTSDKVRRFDLHSRCELMLLQQALGVKCSYGTQYEINQAIVDKIEGRVKK